MNNYSSSNKETLYSDRELYNVTGKREEPNFLQEDYNAYDDYNPNISEDEKKKRIDRLINESNHIPNNFVPRYDGDTPENQQEDYNSIKNQQVETQDTSRGGRRKRKRKTVVKKKRKVTKGKNRNINRKSRRNIKNNN